MGVVTWAQQPEVALPVAGKPNLLRQEGTDAESGIHYVRLMLLAAPAGEDGRAPARFTMECTERGGKRGLNWLVTFGGVEPDGFLPPFRRTPEHPEAPINPVRNLTMDFEGYTKWKPITRSWEELPTGELRYRNPGMHSPNMESPQLFLVYLNSLPALRIGYAKATPGDPAEKVFDTRPLLEELKKTPTCQP